MRSDAGQAAVETALTMPLTLFMVLGALQLSMMINARLLTQYAAFKAARAASLNYSDCHPMQDSAIATLLPSFTDVSDVGGTGPTKLRTEFTRIKGNAWKYPNTYLVPYTGLVMWMSRDLDQISGNGANLGTIEETFDAPLGGIAGGGGSAGFVVVTRIVFWFPLKIPFANWIIARAMLASWQARDYANANPLMPTEKTVSWSTTAGPGAAAPAAASAAVIGEMVARAARKEWVFPIRAVYSMRMMTPARNTAFAPAVGPCPPSPAF